MHDPSRAGRVSRKRTGKNHRTAKAKGAAAMLAGGTTRPNPTANANRAAQVWAAPPRHPRRRVGASVVRAGERPMRVRGRGHHHSTAARTVLVARRVHVPRAPLAGVKAWPVALSLVHVRRPGVLTAVHVPVVPLHTPLVCSTFGKAASAWCWQWYWG